MSHARQDAPDFRYADVLFAPVEAERAALLRRLPDEFPKVSDLIRWSGSGVIVGAVFEKTAALAHGILLINPPLDQPFSVVLYSDKVEFDRAASLRSGGGPGGPDLAGTAFYRAFVEQLGRSLSSTPSTGGTH